jgi:hypothetical protein
VVIWFGLSEMTDSDKPRTSARTRRTKAGQLINQATDKTGQAPDKTRTSRTHPPKGVSVSEVSEMSKEPKKEKPPGPADPGRLEGRPPPLAPADLEGLLVTPATLEGLRLRPADLRAPADPEGWPAP